MSGRAQKRKNDSDTSGGPSTTIRNLNDSFEASEIEVPVVTRTPGDDSLPAAIKHHIASFLTTKDFKNYRGINKSTYDALQLQAAQREEPYVALRLEEAEKRQDRLDKLRSFQDLSEEELAELGPRFSDITDRELVFALVSAGTLSLEDIHWKFQNDEDMVMAKLNSPKPDLKGAGRILMADGNFVMDAIKAVSSNDDLLQRLNQIKTILQNMDVSLHNDPGFMRTVFEIFFKIAMTVPLEHMGSNLIQNKQFILELVEYVRNKSKQAAHDTHVILQYVDSSLKEDPDFIFDVLKMTNFSVLRTLGPNLENPAFFLRLLRRVKSIPNETLREKALGKVLYFAGQSAKNNEEFMFECFTDRMYITLTQLGPSLRENLEFFLRLLGWVNDNVKDNNDRTYYANTIRDYAGDSVQSNDAFNNVLEMVKKDVYN